MLYYLIMGLVWVVELMGRGLRMDIQLKVLSDFKFYDDLYENGSKFFALKDVISGLNDLYFNLEEEERVMESKKRWQKVRGLFKGRSWKI